MYFNVGYPLGFAKKGDNPVDNCIFELQNRDVKIGAFELILWFQASSFVGEVPSDRLKSLDVLIEHGVIIKADSNEELYEKTKDFKLIRQGLPALSGGSEPIPTISIGLTFTNLSLRQIAIWRMANGSRTLKEIYDYFKEIVSLHLFMDEIVLLKKEMLIFLI